jgi:hypothetical protein
MKTGEYALRMVTINGCHVLLQQYMEVLKFVVRKNNRGDEYRTSEAKIEAAVPLCPSKTAK